MWLLGRLLPLMIGYWVPEEDEHWLSYLLLLDIVDILFAPDISPVLIEDHHNEFTVIYPSNPVIPKMHFMVHMAELIRQ